MTSDPDEDAGLACNPDVRAGGVNRPRTTRAGRKSATARSRPGVVVDHDAQSNEDHATVPTDRAAAGGSLAPAVDGMEEPSGAIARLHVTVPTDEQLAVALACANDDRSLIHLHAVVSAWQRAAQQFDLAHRELVRLAESRLMIERKLGAELAQTVKRGGNRSKCPKATLDGLGNLPDGVSRKQSMVYQRLAAIPESVFRQYIDACRSRRVVPSSMGTLLHTRHGGERHRGVARAASANFQLPDAAVEAVGRSMTVDVLVGEAKIHAVLRLQPDAKDVLERLGGSVFVARCPTPSAWIPRLQELQRNARVARVALGLPAEVWSPWFEDLVAGGWTICFLRNAATSSRGVLLCHFGEKPAAFRLAFKGLGPIIG